MTYDAVQMSAVLTYCVVCHHWVYLTVWRPICVRGRRNEAKTR